MSATRVEPAYTNGTGASSVPDSAARSEVFYEKLLQLHKDVIAGKNPRLTFAQAPPNFQSRNANSTTTVPPAAAAHTQTENITALPGLNNYSAAQSFASSAVPFAGAKPSTSSSSTPAKLNPGLYPKNDAIDESLRLRQIKEARQKLERTIAEYAKADEPILKNAREIPLNLLALAHAQVAPVSGLRDDSSEGSFDADSYYSSKANSWSTEHTEPQLGHTDAAIVISDGDDGDDEDLYEPPSQVDATLARAGQPKVPGIQHLEVANANENWEPDWDEEDDYEPPATAAFGGNSHTRPAAQHSTAVSASHAVYAQSRQRHPGSGNTLQPPYQAGYGAQMPTIAVNQIPTPAAPQPSRISPLTTGNLTRTMQSQISNIQQAQGDNGALQNNRQGEPLGNNAMSAKELKKARRLAKKEAKAATAESSKKRKRGATPERKQDKKGKRRAVDRQHGTPEPYIKPEPTSPPSGLAAIPSRRPSVVHRHQVEATVQSSPYSTTRPRSAYVSDQEHSPRGHRYADSDATDRLAMPPPQPIRRVERDSQDLRRVASLQYARRPLSPAQDYAVYTDPRAPSRLEYAEPPMSHGSPYREGSMRPSTARPPRSPSPGRGAPTYAPQYTLPAPRPGEIVTDAYGNRYIAELVPDEYPPPSRRAHAEDYYAQYPPTRRAEVYEEDGPKVPRPTRSRAYSQLPDPAEMERRARAYSHVPEAAPDLRASQRAYSVHPAAVPQHREIREYDQAAAYDRRPVPSQYDEQTSPRTAAYTSEYAPIPRAYSVRPDAPRRDMLPEYSARGGSIAPAGFSRRGEMAPPALPVMRSRDAGPADDRYRYAASGEGRGQYDERRVASYRY
jgi:hypothetical protein